MFDVQLCAIHDSYSVSTEEDEATFQSSAEYAEHLMQDEDEDEMEG